MSLAIAVLVSGNGSNLQAIIDAIQCNEIDVSINIVISDRNDAKGLERAKKAGITTTFIDPAKFQSRQHFDNAISELLTTHKISLVVLAGFMRILSDQFVTRHLGALINIHPSLLPKYKGLNTHQRVINAGETEHGASVHFVTPKLDDGPIILQSSIKISIGDTSTTLKQKVHKVEHIIYPQAIKWISDGRIKLKNDKVYLDDILIDEKTQKLSIT